LNYTANAQTLDMGVRRSFFKNYVQNQNKEFKFAKF
jgi:hypothetical protein